MERTLAISRRWLSSAEAREYLGGLSERTFYNWRQRSGVRPHELMPNTLLFDRREIDAAVRRSPRREVVAKVGAA